MTHLRHALPVLLMLAACGNAADDGAQGAAASGPTDTVRDQQPADLGAAAADQGPPSSVDQGVRARLELAFEAASKLPERPHVKTRSRLQGQLVDAALAVGDVEFAMTHADAITNWRKGRAQAAVAAHLAEQGRTEEARAALAVAEATEATLTDEFDQGWRRDRVRVTIARAYAYLGDPATAAAIQAGATPSEAGRLAPVAVQTVAREDADRQMETLQEIAKTGDMEQIQFALLAMAEFYGRFAEDDERRAAVEERIRSSWKELPIQPRFEILDRLVEFDLERGDLETARFTADEMASMVEEHQWNTEDAVALRARAAMRLAQADEPKGARRAADDALAVFDAKTEEIVSIWRGKALRPLAEAYLAMGDPTTASALYERALDDALINPNGRPRVEDLVATVISISRAGLAPGEALQKKLRAVAGALGEPW